MWEYHEVRNGIYLSVKSTSSKIFHDEHKTISCCNVSVSSFISLNRISTPSILLIPTTKRRPPGKSISAHIFSSANTICFLYLSFLPHSCTLLITLQYCNNRCFARLRLRPVAKQTLSRMALLPVLDDFRYLILLLAIISLLVAIVTFFTVCPPDFLS